MRDTSERFNMPDSLKAQYTAHLKKGNVLMSDNGRVLASIVEDSLGWHDAICGHTTRIMTDEKYGKTTYQEQRNEFYRCGEEYRRQRQMCIRDRDPSVEYPSVPVTMEVYDAPKTDLMDECVNHRDENYRAFENTWDYYNMLGE